jgi:hypothetical protein
MAGSATRPGRDRDRLRPRVRAAKASILGPIAEPRRAETRLTNDAARLAGLPASSTRSRSRSSSRTRSRSSRRCSSSTGAAS